MVLPDDQITKQDFLLWYEPIHSSFIRYCESKCFGRITAEDLVQETILATLSSFHKIKDKEKLLQYMMATANNMIKNQLRKSKFRAPWSEQSAALLEAKGVDPELALDIQFLYKAIDKLSKDYKECILLFEISGFSIKEISIIQGVSEGAIKTRLHRSRKKLKRLMSEEYGPASVKKLLQVYSFILL